MGCPPHSLPSLPSTHSSTFSPRPLVAMSDTDAERQLLLDELHHQFNNAISYHLYTGLAYGTRHHYAPPFSAHFPVALQGCFLLCTLFQSEYSCESHLKLPPSEPFRVSLASPSAPKDPCSIPEETFSCLEAQRSSLCWLLS